MKTISKHYTDIKEYLKDIKSKFSAKQVKDALLNDLLNQDFIKVEFVSVTDFSDNSQELILKFTHNNEPYKKVGRIK